MNSIRIIIFIICIILCFAGSSIAACWYGGQQYNTGDVIGNYVCSANGQWVLL